MRFPLLGKVAALGAVGLSLVWALAAVEGVVSEREGRLHEAQRSVADSLAGAQALVGPVLSRQCSERWDSWQGEGKERKLVSESREFMLAQAPQRLFADGRVTIEPRYRGIFRVNGYAAKLTLSAEWADLAALQPQALHAGSRIACAAPALFVALSDARGIRTAQVRVNGDALRVEAGTGHPSHPRGLHASLAPNAEGPQQAELQLELIGTEGLAFTPAADNTQVKLASNWPHPSFGGRFLPAERSVTDKGFDARWQISGLATSAQQEIVSGRKLCASGDGLGADGADCAETFGVAFIDPVSPYVLSDRATKYGLLFVALTFVAVALVEVMKRLRVHPIQYLMVGAALVIFFLLLVSLTEHLAFGWAYLAAAGACTALLAFYGSHVLGGVRPGLVFGASIGALYGLLYVLLQMEQSALVLGSLLLFAVLAAVMTVTRKLDWYALMAQLRNELPSRPAPLVKTAEPMPASEIGTAAP